MQSNIVKKQQSQDFGFLIPNPMPLPLCTILGKPNSLPPSQSGICGKEYPSGFIYSHEYRPSHLTNMRLYLQVTVTRIHIRHSFSSHAPPQLIKKQALMTPIFIETLWTSLSLSICLKKVPSLAWIRGQKPDTPSLFPS